MKTAQATVHDRIEEEDTAANVFEEDIGDRVVLKTSLTNCVTCKVGNIVPKNRGEKEAMLVYGRNGTYRAIHQEFNCNNQNSKCGTSYFFSFYKHGGKKVYYAPSPAEGRAPPKAVNGRGRAGCSYFACTFDMHI